MVQVSTDRTLAIFHVGGLFWAPLSSSPARVWVPEHLPLLLIFNLSPCGVSVISALAGRGLWVVVSGVCGVVVASSVEGAGRGRGGALGGGGDRQGEGAWPPSQVSGVLLPPRFVCVCPVSLQREHEPP